MRAKNPQHPPHPLEAGPGDIREYDAPLWRIHRATGTHRQRWSDMRADGPLPQMRWDPHPEPRGHYPDAAVAYAAPDVITAFAEVFQTRRRITLTEHQALAGWTPTRTLRLLDLTTPDDPDDPDGPDRTRATPWALRNGASASLDSAPRSTCRAWSRAICRTWPDLDGLYVRSTVIGRPMVVLYAHARDAFPDAPDLARRLDDPALAGTVQRAAAILGWPALRA